MRRLLVETQSGHRIVSVDFAEADIQTLITSESSRGVILGIAASFEETRRWAFSCPICREERLTTSEKLPDEVFPGLSKNAVVRLLQASLQL